MGTTTDLGKWRTWRFPRRSIAGLRRRPGTGREPKPPPSPRSDLRL